MRDNITYFVIFSMAPLILRLMVGKNTGFQQVSRVNSRLLKGFMESWKVDYESALPRSYGPSSSGGVKDSRRRISESTPVLGGEAIPVRTASRPFNPTRSEEPREARRASRAGREASRRGGQLPPEGA